MSNVIEACKKSGARLVFFDNVYMYGRVAGPMTEVTPFNPCSAKGEIRARVATRLLDEIKQGGAFGDYRPGSGFLRAECAHKRRQHFGV
jgi:hypothetical protein